MIILGIGDGITSGAALIRDGKILSAISEERLVRKKQAYGAPRLSISAVLEIAGIKPKEIDAVAIAGVNSNFKEEVKEWRGWFEERKQLDSSRNLFFQAASNFGSLAVFPPIKNAYYLLRSPIYRNRRKRWIEVLDKEFDIRTPVKFYSHHYCHATGAYYTSGFQDALVVTMDGGGDGSSSHIYHARDGRLHHLSTTDSFNSLGNYYAYVTALCGYKAQKHEGKITGLAAHGQPVYYDYLASFIEQENGRLVNKGRVLFFQALSKISEGLPNGWKKEDLAASIQRLSEDICRDYVRYWLEYTGESNVVLTGGVFANVRINQEIKEIPQVKNILVHPGMSDEGLGLGAAMAFWSEKELETNKKLSNDYLISDVYFGPEFSEDEIRIALQEAGLEYEQNYELEKRIAQLLTEGYVVARVNGRMEYGPRALGNRSILYHPTDKSVNDWLNKNLVRTEFMPFAPSTLFEEAHRCYMNLDGSCETACFMTITYVCTDWMKETCPGVVHLDDTARPQLVRREDNPSYYQIIKEFYELTGLPSIINTSFNMHEEPIVCTPQDAIRAFQKGHLDYLAIGPFLVRNPKEITHPLVPCKKDLYDV